MVIYVADGKVPVPDGWTLEGAVRVLREVGHKVLHIESKGVRVPLPKEAA